MNENDSDLIKAECLVCTAIAIAVMVYSVEM